MDGDMIPSKEPGDRGAAWMELEPGMTARVSLCALRCGHAPPHLPSKRRPLRDRVHQLPRRRTSRREDCFLTKSVGRKSCGRYWSSSADTDGSGDDGVPSARGTYDDELMRGGETPWMSGRRC